MQRGIILAAAFLATTFTAMSLTGARAENWCGFSFRPHAVVQCGYSSIGSCENEIGKGAMCFLNPSVAMNDGRTKLATAQTAHASRVDVAADPAAAR